MKVELSVDDIDRVVRAFLKEYKGEFKKWDGRGVPHVDYDMKLENKYRKQMRKAFDLIGDFVGLE